MHRDEKLQHSLAALVSVSFLLLILAPVFMTHAQDIAVGNSETEVRQIMGNPKGKMKNGAGSMWLYDNAEVYFENGKVKNIQGNAARSQSAPAAAPKPAQPAVARPSQPAVPSIQKNVPARSSLPADATNIKQAWTDASGANQSRIICTFGLPTLSTAAREAIRQKGTVPYRITAVVLVPAQPGNASKMTLVRTGSCLIRMYNESGAEVLNTSIPADKLCPS
ncbi:MAG: hypothetical protein A2283_15545 [Lentisphaerae bacterium RIFOXYA12_FULL_48_11]|nr:MAG: hypothetical protein A2283_15545 [Lentisphaerae bacterium RIFOXYA12_FULL_48_11]